MDKSELINIRGGNAVNSVIVNAVVRLINTALEFGRTLGSVLRRSKSKKFCKI